MDRKATSIAQNNQNYAMLLGGAWWTAGHEQPSPLLASLVRCAFVYILYFEQWRDGVIFCCPPSWGWSLARGALFCR